MDDHREVGQRVRRIRQLSNFGQEDVAKALQEKNLRCSHSHYRKIESGMVPLTGGILHGLASLFAAPGQEPELIAWIRSGLGPLPGLRYFAEDPRRTPAADSEVREHSAPYGTAPSSRTADAEAAARATYRLLQSETARRAVGELAAYTGETEEDAIVAAVLRKLKQEGN